MIRGKAIARERRKEKRREEEDTGIGFPQSKALYEAKLLFRKQQKEVTNMAADD